MIPLTTIVPAVAKLHKDIPDDVQVVIFTTLGSYVTVKRHAPRLKDEAAESVTVVLCPRERVCDDGARLGNITFCTGSPSAVASVSVAEDEEVRDGQVVVAGRPTTFRKTHNASTEDIVPLLETFQFGSLGLCGENGHAVVVGSPAT